MFDAPIIVFNSGGLIPIYPEHDDISICVNLSPNGVFLKGTILGLVTSSANDVQTATITGGPTGGTFTISATLNGVTQTTTPIAYNATGATVQTALQALTLLQSNVTVSGGVGGPYVATFAGSLANTPIPPMSYSVAGLTGGTPVITNVHTTTGRSGDTFTTYASGNTDGSQIPRVILRFDCATDAQGLITLGQQTGGGQWGETSLSVACYASGTFKCEDLIGLDANALTAWGTARLLNGTVAAGIIHIA